MNQAILSILSQKKSSHGNLRIRKFPVVRKYLRIRNFPLVHKVIYGSVSEAGELGISQVPWSSLAISPSRKPTDVTITFLL